MNDSRYAIGRSVGPCLGLVATVLLAVAGAKAAVIGGDLVFAKPILDPLLRAFQEDRHPDEPLRVVCRGEWEMAEAFGRGQNEAMLTVGPASDGLRSIVAQHAPGGNLVRWEQVEIGQVRVIAIVNAANTARGLTFGQIQKLLSSETGPGTTWEKLGARGGLVTCYGEHGESASRKILHDRVMRFERVPVPGSPGVLASGWYPFRDNFALCADAREVLDEIAADPNGIGFVVFAGQLPKGVRVLPLSEKPGGDFVTPKLAPVAQKEYALSLPILLHVHPAASPTTRSFARWAGSRAAAR